MNTARLHETGPARELRRRINDVETQMRALMINPGLGYRVHRTSIGTTLDIQRARPVSEPPGVVQRFYLDAAENEWLNCRKADENGVPYGDMVRVAKPAGLRLPASQQTDGEFTIVYLGSNTREVRWTQDPDLKIVERLVPPYGPPAGEPADSALKDTEIYGTKPVGKTGLIINVATPGQELPVPVQLEWIECVAVRQWRPDYKSIKSCAAGDSPLANWQRLVHASDRVNLNA